MRARSRSRRRSAYVGNDPQVHKLLAGYELSRTATHWYDTRATGNTDQLLDNLGTNSDPAVRGSSSADTTNDPTRLVHDGEDYVWLPGTSDNWVTQTAHAVPSSPDVVEQYFRIVPEETATQYAAIGGYWRDSASVADGPGLRWQDVGSGRRVTALWRPVASGPATTLVSSADNFTPGVKTWVRLSYVYDNGSSQTAITIYHSEDQVAHWDNVTTWTDIGSTTIAQTRIVPAGGTVNWTVGSLPQGSREDKGSYLRAGTVVDGVVEAEFNPSDLTGWTINRFATGLKTTVVTQSVDVFDGSDDYWQLPASASIPLDVTDAAALVVLFRDHGTTLGSARLIEGGTSETPILGIRPSSGIVRAEGKSSGGFIGSSDVAASSAGTLQVAAAVYGADSSMRVWQNENGYGPDHPRTSGEDLTSSSPLRVGIDSINNNDLEAEVFATLIFDYALTEQQLDDLSEFLLSKYNPAAQSYPPELGLATSWYDSRDLRQDNQQALPNRFDETSVATIGSAGGAYITDAGLVLPGDAGEYASTPDAAALDIAGDIQIDAYVQPNGAWDVHSSAAAILSKWTTSYIFYLRDDGKLQLSWKESTTNRNVVSSVSATSVFSANEAGYVRVQLDVDNGASGWTAQFFTSSDGSSWAQLGTDVTGGVAGSSIDVGGDALAVGARTGGATEAFLGTIYSVEVRDGIDGTVVASPNFAAQVPGTESFTDDQGNVWTVNTDADTTNDPQTLPWTGEDYVWLPGNASNYLLKTGLTIPSGSVISTASRIESGARGAGGYTRTGGASSARFWIACNASVVTVTYTEDGTTTSRTDSVTLADADTANWLEVELDYANDQIRARKSSSTTYDYDSVTWDSWTAWTSTTYAVKAVSGAGSRGGVFGSLASPCAIAYEHVAVDGVVVDSCTLDPSDLTGWTIARSSTGLKTTVVDGRGVLVFDGSDDEVNVSDPVGITSSTSGKYTWLAVYRGFGNAANSGVLYTGPSPRNAGAGLGVYLSSGDSVVATLRGGSGGIFNAQIPSATVDCNDGELHVVGFVKDDDQLYAVADGNFSTGTTLSGTMPTIDDTNGFGFFGTIAGEAEVFAELRFPGVALTEDELDTISTYLLGEYT